MAQLILTGDVNLMNVNDPTVPFRKTIDEFKAADVRFSNMECCLNRKSTRLNSSHTDISRMPSSA